MEIFSTLLYKKRDKIQIQILRQIAVDGRHSKKSLEHTLEKHHPVIDNAVNQLRNKKLIERAKVIKNDKPGQPEKFYRLSEKGIDILIDGIQIPLDEFWKMVFRFFDSKGVYFEYGRFDSNEEFIDEETFVFQNLTIEKLIQKYENNVLGYARNRVIPNMSPKISDFELITSCKLTSSEKSIIEIFALYGSLSISELSIKLSKQISNIPKKLINLYFLVKSNNDEKFTITILGIQYFIFVILKQLKHDTQIQKIKILLKNQNNLLPLIFKKWIWLTRFFSNRELLNALIDAINTNQRQLPFQTNSGVQEILDSHRNLEDVSKNKIKHMYEIGYDAYSEIRHEKIINLKLFHPKKSKLDNILKMLSTTLDKNSKNQLRKVDKSLQLPITELNKLKILSGIDSVNDSYPTEIRNLHKTTYEQNKSDSLSFRFYSILLSKIHQKNQDQKTWFSVLKTDKDITPWYANWIKEINNFENKNMNYRQNLVNILE